MSRLVELLEPYEKIALMGMCKNAGKTTVLNYLIEQWHDQYKLGIISVGYDGETLDGVTMLPKPKIQLYPGMLAVTCEQCIKGSTAEVEVVQSLNLQTVLGEVFIVRGKDLGTIELSGPSTVEQTLLASEMLRTLGCEKIIVDGAAGRMAFSTVAETAVLSIGAALASNLPQVIKLASHKIRLLTIHETTDAKEKQLPKDHIYLKDGNTYLFRGVVTDKDLLLIMKKYKDPWKVIGKDPTVFFISDVVLRRFEDNGGKIEVLKTLHLSALTVNPMNPYGPWLDSADMMTAIKAHTDLPIFDVLQED